MYKNARNIYAKLGERLNPTTSRNKAIKRGGVPVAMYPLPGNRGFESHTLQYALSIHFERRNTNERLDKI